VGTFDENDRLEAEEEWRLRVLDMQRNPTLGPQDPCWRRLDDPATSGAATTAMTPTTF